MGKELKQKQIEEMAKVMSRHYEQGGICGLKDFSEALYEQGYRKIPKGAVVLEKSVYESLDIKLYRDIITEKVRKETAEKFAERLKEMAYQSTDWSHGEHPMVVEVDYIDEIAKEFTEG